MSATISTAEIDIVAHDYLNPVVDYRGARHREQQGIKQLDFATAVCQQWSKTPTDSKIYASVGVGSVNAVHVVAFLVGDQFQGQLVMVAKKHRPLTLFGNGRSLLENADNA